MVYLYFISNSKIYFHSNGSRSFVNAHSLFLRQISSCVIDSRHALGLCYVDRSIIHIILLVIVGFENIIHSLTVNFHAQSQLFLNRNDFA